MGKRRRKVYCSGCANLMVVKGLSPMCTATAKFVGGPLRRCIDIVGIVHAEKRNIKNDCRHREAVSLRAFKIKRWIIWRLNDGKTRKIQERRLNTYPISEEGSRSGVYQRKNFEHDIEVEEIWEQEEEDLQDFLFDRGIDDRDGTGTSDLGGGDDEYSESSS